MKPCPKCNSPYGYSMGNEIYACPACYHEWNPTEEITTEETQEEDVFKVMDANGNELADGDSVIIVKDLPVKGASKPIKSGTKVKSIRLIDGADNHNINCKIAGFGSMALKSEFVRKA